MTQRQRMADLVLARYEGESIELDLPSGRQVVVTVNEIQKTKVRLGFHAPLDVRIMRSELKRHDEPVAKRFSYLDKFMQAFAECLVSHRDGLDVESTEGWARLVKLYEDGK